MSAGVTVTRRTPRLDRALRIAQGLGGTYALRAPGLPARAVRELAGLKAAGRDITKVTPALRASALQAARPAILRVLTRGDGEPSTTQFLLPLAAGAGRALALAARGHIRTGYLATTLSAFTGWVLQRIR